MRYLCKKWWAAGLGLCVVLVSLARAQEVAVSENTGFAGHPAMDVWPAFKKKLAPKFPKEVLKSDEPGYAIVSYYTDETGKNRARFVLGTLALYENALEDALMSARAEPARREGKPTATWFWFSVIFNPPATVGTAEAAAPKLLAVTPIIAPAKWFGRGESPFIVPIQLTLSSTAEISNVVVDDRYAKVQALVEQAVQGWKFSPARKGGVAVATTFRMSVIVQSAAGVTPAGGAKGVPPKPIKFEPPKYPYGMLNSGMVGEVTLEFTISKAGKVQDIFVRESNNPGFNDQAIEAVSRWTFHPATVNGLPVTTRVSQKLEFDLPGGGSTGYSVERAKPKKGAPAPANVPDVSPVARSTGFAVYPYELLAAEEDGSAKVKMLIDDGGRVVRVEVVEATHREFGLALAAAVESFAFNPALKDGKPVMSAMGMEQKFRRYGSAALVSQASLDLLRQEKKQPESIVKISALDEPLKPMATQAPKFPPSLDVPGATGSALVEFLVDEEGRVHLPRIIEASKPEFGYAAVQAVATWRFEKPVAKGKPATVRVRLPVEFAHAAPDDKK